MVKLRASVLLVLCGLCWSLAAVVSKRVLDFIPPVTLLSLQLGTSVIFLWLVSRVRQIPIAPRWQPPVRKRWRNTPRIVLYTGALLGVLEPGLSYLFNIIGLNLTSVSAASVLTVAEPIGVIILAAVLLRERISLPMLALAAVGCVGLALVSTAETVDTGVVSTSFTGNVLILLGMIMGSLYVVLTRRALGKSDPLLLSASQQTIGLVCVLLALPVALFMGEAHHLAEVPWDAWLLAALAGVLQYSLAFWFYWEGAKNANASTASLYMMLIPVFGALGGVVLLNEQLNQIQIVGGLLILLAVFGVSQLGSEDLPEEFDEDEPAPPKPTPNKVMLRRPGQRAWD